MKLTAMASDGTEARAADEGAGPIILALHPGLDDGASWGKVAALLAPRFRVVRLHRRRYRLDLAADSCTFAQEVEHVLAVARALGGGPMLLVGHSSGAVPALVSLLAGVGVAVVPRMRALVPAQIGDSVAIDALGIRLGAYARIEAPVVLLGGDRSPAHLGERLDALAKTLPQVERVVLRGQGHGAHAKAPGRVAAVIETLATEVLGPAR
ncbi:alpha/beta fold hydrolase [Nonomuraea sp. NPDC002799]